MANADGVVYADSLRPHQAITQYIENQLLQLFPYHCDEDGKLTMAILPSTPQTNTIDCGVYAAAYATELVFGKVVAGLQSPFDVSAMRGHLERCLDNHGLTPFPHDPDRGRGKRLSYDSTSDCRREWRQRHYVNWI